MRALQAPALKKHECVQHKFQMLKDVIKINEDSIEPKDAKGMAIQFTSVKYVSLYGFHIQ